MNVSTLPQTYDPQGEIASRFAGCPVQTRPELREAAIRLHVYRETTKQVAEAMNVNVYTVRLWTRRTDFRALASWLVDRKLEQDLGSSASPDVKATFDEHAAEMQERLYAIAQMTGNEKLAADICMDWLDRAGHPAKRPAAAAPTFIFGADALAELARRAREAELEGAVIEAELVQARVEQRE